MNRIEPQHHRSGLSLKEDLYPLRFTPVYKQALWGGSRFASFFGRSIPKTDEPVAESWEIADHPHGESIIANGPLAGMTLGQLVRSRPRDLFGPGNFNPLAPPSRFPLILKYLDARLPLSVQIHPDDETARQLGCSDPGKTEAWIVVDAEPESELWVGTNRCYTRRELEQAIHHGRIESCLHRLRAKPGDCFYLKPGTLHALGAGILVAEIQTGSDLTFRVHDWNRVDHNGVRRPLHIDDALRSFPENNGPLHVQVAEKTSYDRIRRMVIDPRFELHRHRIEKSFPWVLDGRCHLLTVLEGSLGLSLPTESGPEKTWKSVHDVFGGFYEELRRGDSVLLPASLSRVFAHVEAEAVVFDATVGEIPHEAAMETLWKNAA